MDDRCKYCDAQMTNEPVRSCFIAGQPKTEAGRYLVSRSHCPRCYANCTNGAWTTPLFDVPKTPWRKEQTT